MKLYLIGVILLFIIGIVMIVYSIIQRKKLPPWLLVLLISAGILIIIGSVVMCLCLGFFMYGIVYR